MIDADLGFDGTEIVDRIVNFMGEYDDRTKVFVVKTLPFAIQRYCKLHDWSFLFKYNLELVITQGTSEYELDVDGIGFKMSCDNVSSIYSPTGKKVLVKRDITRLREDSSFYNSAGPAATNPDYWAEIGDSRILLGPEKFATGTLRIDGKIDTTALETAVAAYDIVSAPDELDEVFPEIPFKYQEGFIEYALAMCLDRGNDERASSKKAEAKALVELDIQDDLRRAGDIMDLRFHSLKEFFGEDY